MVKVAVKLGKGVYGTPEVQVSDEEQIKMRPGVVYYADKKYASDPRLVVVPGRAAPKAAAADAGDPEVGTQDANDADPTEGSAPAEDGPAGPEAGAGEPKRKKRKKEV